MLYTGCMEHAYTRRRWTVRRRRLHAACMHAAYAGLSGVDDGLPGVVARMHPAASCQST